MIGEEEEAAPTRYEMYGKPPTSRTMKTHLTTLFFLTIAISHLFVANGAKTKVLFVISLVLAFDNSVLALGGLPLPFSLLQYLGRLRYFTAVLAWPYFLSFAFSLGKNCGWITVTTSEAWEEIFLVIAVTCTLVFVGREIMWFIRGPPLSMIDPKERPNFGDCLPSNALLGGAFGINKYEAEDNRIVYIPIPERSGIGAPSGLCVLEHLAVGFAALFSGVYSMFLCALIALIGRMGTNLYFKKRRTVVARMIPRVGEALWLWGCLWQESCMGW
eukprot:GEMP01033609.1.p1 GENE.GEMP01033609.1~~GEMP01033609.1.p1  ORF type:complete len:273 (+),score=57.45 GEMP01033609.1:138-956(+)